jgi:hypothetical protein
VRFKLRFQHWLPLVTGVLLLAARATPLPRYGSLLGLPALCPLKALTGVPCPGCGMTRSLVLSAHGQWAAALWYHPLGPLVFALLILAFCAGVLRLLCGNRNAMISSRVFSRSASIAAFGFAALLTMTWILRMLNVVPFPPHF